MRLTKATDLALRITMRLAVLDEQSAPTTRDVARSVGATYTHAAKVVTRLHHLGVVDAQRGRGGGLTLTPLARTSSLGWLIRELEGVGDVVGCDDEPPCPLRSACRLRTALRQAQQAFYAFLDPISIEDLVAAPADRMLLALTSYPTPP